VLRAKVGVLAAGERGEGVGGVLFQGGGGGDDEADGAGADLAVDEGVEDLGLCGFEGDGIDDGVGASEVGDDFGGLDVGAVVAGFGDQQDGPTVAGDGRGFVLIEHVVGVVDGAEGDGVVVIAGLDFAEVVGEGAGVGGEFADEVDV